MSSSELVTIVTAFKDIGRGSWSKNASPRPPKWLERNNDEYFNNFKRLCALENQIIVFAANDMRDRLLAIRHDLIIIDIDVVWNKHINLRDRIAAIHNQSAFRKFVDSPKMPEYWNSDYVYVNFLKSFFVREGMKIHERGSIFAWVDFGYVREKVYLPEDLVWKFDPKEKVCFFSAESADLSLPIFELIKTGYVCIQGSMIIAPRMEWEVFPDRFLSKVNILLEAGLIDDDQTILLMMYRDDPAKYKLINYSKSEWFVGFRHTQG